MQEIDPIMRAGLAERLPLGCHLFGDVMDVFGDGPAVHRQFLNISEYNDKLEYASELPLYTTAYCHRHQRRCPVQTGAAARMGGIPCQDYSPAGTRAGVTGPNYPAVLGFSYKCSVSNTALIGIECVPSLPREVPMDAFRHDQVTWVMDEILQPEDVAFEHIARPRLLACNVFRLWKLCPLSFLGLEAVHGSRE